jgi:cellulose synthase/poly-beta-1,6-N-acetylglucosamine synthase-like glycosyltransferase
LALDYPDYEILVLPDFGPELNSSGVRIIPTGLVTPGAKRNIGIANSSGEICAFVDSDAYPRRDWLKNAVRYINSSETSAVGGPGITPSEDSDMQKASGHVLSSFMVGGVAERYKAKSNRESGDIHSCNFVSRKSVLLEAGCWDERYWPGEDTLLCLKIKKLGGKMVEAPDVVVYHHRRPLFKQHLKQVSRFGLHRGFFAKRFPETSRKLTYFLPSLSILFLVVGGVVSLVYPIFRWIFVVLLSAYITLALIAALPAKNMKLILPTWLGIIATHMVYGTYFLIGLMSSKLKR